MDGQQKAKGGLSTTARAGLVVIVVIITAAVLAYAAWRMSVPVPTPIGEILADLRHYDGLPVTIRGEVTNTLNVMMLKSFELTDDSGSIMVVTKRGLPDMGETITVSGVVHQVFEIAGVEYTVVLEPAERD